MNKPQENRWQVLDIYNEKTKHLVWRGTSSRGVAGSATAETRRMDRIIDEMLKNIPPA